MSTPAPAFAYAFAREQGVVLLGVGDRARVGLREDADPAALLEARRSLGLELDVEMLPRAAFDRRLSELYADAAMAGGAGELELPGDLDALAGEIPATADLLDARDDAPVIRLINGLIAEAARIGASDVHIEPFESALVVRMRVDGVMREALRLPGRIAPLLVSRVKVMARLDIAEKRLPQDGRIGVAMGHKALDVRVSTLPARGGERVVMRILDKDQNALSLDGLGMQPAVREALGRALRMPNGIVLVTGPTGAGKTTTLYAALASLNDGRRNILTVEDPVEYAIDGVGQTQVNARVGMSFAAGLRAILRQDPDVVMVGEVRDPETAQIAVQASLTGHLVLSTVHTNDAPGAVTRLRDMGIEPFLLASSLRLVLAQRLLRRLCAACRQPAPVDAAAAALLGGAAAGATLYHATGCTRCSHTGYAGRLGIHEALEVDERMRQLIGAGADEDALAAAAFGGGGRLGDAARAAVLRGETTLEEAMRVTRQDLQDHGGV
ncbi:type II secretion system ATPase GspE [Luteimonas sp. M1R5S18]|uniref:Type II secretion system protein E n=1 Tax=Luteimonas rhizosphaericola TaxID=3042024 RepID=A0ABT6JJ34_9GAMM|nr:type II secretion system ATPase GspE [Luteimonas rhizosphaericola]MDH5830692.1 type II secretion system ATPase GspE [Luteimonas rhizosphaericola]